jgi:molecular chaperone GrpE
MSDKVSELRNILNKKKAAEVEEFDPEVTLDDLESAVTFQESEEEAEVETQPKAKSKKKGATSKNKQTPELEQQLQAMQKECEDLKAASKTQSDMYLAKAAEFENFKKRLTKEHDEFTKYANEKLVTDLLPVLDSLEMTLSHCDSKTDDPMITGVRLVHRQFVQALAKYGVEEIRGQGEAFDPHRQEAIGMEENTELEADKVAKVHRTGYILNGKVLRAAMVTVTK